MASTGKRGRRAFLKAAGAAPLLLAGGAAATAADYGSAVEVFAAIERLEDEVDARLRAVEKAVPAAAAFGVSVRRDRARHRRERAALRLRLGLPAGAPEVLDGDGDGDEDGDPALEDLRIAQQALVHAHAEGLPALGDPHAVDRLGAHMVDLARQLTVLELWIEQEEAGG